MFLINIIAKFRAWQLYRQTLRELSGLNDRELADLGISRYDIAEIARRHLAA
jgi:uncharacterized protein YjiS (DUF1127 family)